MKIITIREYFNPNNALLDKTLLNAFGVTSFIQDDNLIRMNWFYTIAIRFVKLQVYSMDFEFADSLLKTRFNDLNNIDINDSDFYCPKCKSENAEFKKFPWYMTFLSFVFIGFPFPFFKKLWICNNCGYSWKSRNIEKQIQCTETQTPPA